MRPLVRHTPDGMRYTTLSGAPNSPRQSTNGAAAQRREPRAKLSEDDVREARAWHREGRFGVGDLAYIFGVSQPTMSALINRHTWRDVIDVKPTPAEQES